MGRAAALLVLLTGCSTQVEIGQECPKGHPVCDPAREPTSELPSQDGEVLAAPGPALSVVIESGGVATQQVALSCDTPCVFVKAVAHGGTGPYAFLWEDGSTEPARELCPAVSAQYRVSATDAGGSGSDRQGPASAEFGVVMPSCDDIQNAPTSADNVPMDPAPAVTSMVCETLRSQRRPADWSTRGCDASIWALIPQPLQAGRPHRIEAMGQGLFEGRWRVEVWGSSDGCALVEKLGEFSVAQAPVDTLVEFEPKHDHEMLVLSVVEEMDSELWRPYLGYVMCTAAPTP
jgi:hypothetical protein